MSNNTMKPNTLEMKGGGLFGDNAKEYFIKNVKSVETEDINRITKYVGEEKFPVKESGDVDKQSAMQNIKEKFKAVEEDTLNNYWKTFTGDIAEVKEIINTLTMKNDTINDITFAKFLNKEDETLTKYQNNIIMSEDDAGQEYKKVKFLIKFIQNVIIANAVMKPKESAMTSNTFKVITSDKKELVTTKKDFYEIKLMDKFLTTSSDGNSNDETKYNNYINDNNDTYRKKAIDKINKSLKEHNVDVAKLRYLDHIHESDTATKELIESTDGVSSKKLANLISDRYELLQKLKTIFDDEKDNFDRTKLGNDEIIIKADLMNDLYAFIKDIHKPDYYTLISWIKRDKTGDEVKTYPRTIIQIKKQEQVKKMTTGVKTTDRLVMIIKYNIFDKNANSRTFDMNKAYTFKRVILKKVAQGMFTNRASKIGSFLGKKMGFSGGKTHKRKPKATKKKNRPVKQKFTRKHRGGMSMGELDKQGPILVDFYKRLDKSLANDNAKKLATSLENAKIYAMTKRGARRINGNILKPKVTGQNKEIRDEFLMGDGYYQMNNQMMKVSTKVGGILKKRDPKLTITFSEQMFIDPAVWLDNQVGKDDSWIETYLDAQDGKKVFKNTSENVSEYNKIKTDIKGFVDETLTLNPLKDPKTATLMRRQITDAIKNEKLTNITNEEYLANEKYKNLNSIFDLFAKHSDHTHDMSKTNIHINNGLNLEKEHRVLLADQFTDDDQTDSKPSETVTEPSSTEVPTALPKPDDTPEFIPQVTKEKKED